MCKRKKILIFIDWFLPGYKAGGPVRSMANMVDYLKDYYDFYIITRNTDYTENKPYESIKSDAWVDFSDGVKVFYASYKNQKLSTYRELLNSEDFDIIYINGIYSIKYSILPLLVSKKFQGKVIVAPRGMLAKSAIHVKGYKKKLFLKFVKAIGLYRNVRFHVTNNVENEDVLREINPNANCYVANNLPKKKFPSDKSITKEGGKLRLVSMARISPEKNTLFAIEKLSELSLDGGEVIFDLYGHIYNQSYWSQCEQVIKKLPNHIKVKYKGIVDSEEVGTIIQQYHALFLPSRGENFGHVILESFMSGRPVIISDQTPWKDLESNMCGWDLPLWDKTDGNIGNNAHINSWRDVLTRMLYMDQIEFADLSNGAKRRAEQFVNNPDLIDTYKRLFND